MDVKRTCTIIPAPAMSLSIHVVSAYCTRKRVNYRALAEQHQSVRCCLVNKRMISSDGSLSNFHTEFSFLAVPYLLGEISRRLGVCVVILVVMVSTLVTLHLVPYTCHEGIRLAKHINHIQDKLTCLRFIPFVQTV